MEKLKLKKLWISFGILLVIFTYIICLMPIESHGPSVPGLDKVVHFSIYFILCFWFNLAFEHKAKNFILPLMLLMGISIELLQNLTPSRSFDLYDILANSIGCFAGLIFSIKGPSQLFVWIERIVIKE